MDIYRSKKLDECGLVQKQQWVRLLDIFILGPVGIYIGYLIITKQRIDEWIGIFVILYGITTIIFNGANYTKNL